MKNEEHYCDNCGTYRVEIEGQHCSLECHKEYWADMDRDER